MHKPFTWITTILVCIMLLTSVACAQNQPTPLPTLLVVPTGILVTDTPSVISVRPTLPPVWTPTFTFTPTPDISRTPTLTLTPTSAPTETPSPTARPTLSIGRNVVAFVRSGDIRQKGLGEKYVSDIYLLDMGSGSLVNLTETEQFVEHAPRWSPDGKQLVYLVTITGEDYYGLYVQAVDRSYPPRIILRGMAVLQPNWSADGKYIIFASDVGDYTDLFMIDTEGENLIQLTQTNGVDENEPAWSPDGSTILFSQKTGHRQESQSIVVVDADCVNVPGSCADGHVLAHGRFGAWSPDSQKIAYSSEGGADPGIRVFIMNVDGSSARQLTKDEFGGWAELAAWSPDGQQIIYHHERVSEKPELVIINVDGSGERVITDIPFAFDDNFPAWRPD